MTALSRSKKKEIKSHILIGKQEKVISSNRKKVHVIKKNLVRLLEKSNQSTVGKTSRFKVETKQGKKVYSREKEWKMFLSLAEEVVAKEFTTTALRRCWCPALLL